MSINTVRLQFLMDNGSHSPEILCEHGLSILIEVDEYRPLLFDTGESINFAKNATQMNVDLTRVETFVFSHGHYDHTGGFPALHSLLQNKRLLCHPDVFQERFALEPDGTLENIGMPEATREILGSSKRFSLTTTKEPHEILPDVWFTGEVPRVPGSSAPTGDDFRLRDGTIDPLNDDASIFVRSSCGTLLICGCAHAGLESILHRVSALTNGTPILCIVGGLHLRNSTLSELERTRQLLDAYGVKTLAGCHCTGESSLDWLRAHWSGDVLSPVAGTRLEFSEGRFSCCTLHKTSCSR